VRVGCCVVLDHFMDEAAVPELMANLGHENARVRSMALHALACDRCKEGSCRPGEEDVIPIAIRMLLGDESRGVRKTAAHMLTPAVHKRDDVRRVLEHARDHYPDRLVHKVAGWGGKGGPIFRRLTPKPVRKTREQVQADRLAKRARDLRVREEAASGARVFAKERPPFDNELAEAPGAPEPLACVEDRCLEQFRERTRTEAPGESEPAIDNAWR
jgi:HEAT repeat protein